MTKETKVTLPPNKKRVKGTVLFTVVCVMMVLIVFLMGTLALAATANKRANTNYQKEQTEYTARAVLDAVLAKANEQDATTHALTDQAKALQDKIDSATGTESDLVEVTLSDQPGKTYTVKVSKRDTQHYYTGAKWEEYPVYRLSVTVGKDTTAASTTYSCDIAVDINENGGKNPPSGGGAFVSMGKTSGNQIGTNGLVTGGTAINIDGEATDDIVFMNKTINEATVYINGNVSTNAQVGIRYDQMAEKQYYAVAGDLTVNNNMTIDVLNSTLKTTLKSKEIPFIFVGETLQPISQVDLFTNVPVNVYAGRIQNVKDNGLSGDGGNLHIKGDTYLFSDGETSVIGNNAHQAKLEEWADETFTISNTDGKTMTSDFGGLFSRGNVVIAGNGADIKGDFRALGDITIDGKCTVKGDVVCNGKLTVNGELNLSADSKVYAAEIAGKDKIKGTDAANIYDWGTLYSTTLTRDEKVSGVNVNETISTTRKTVTTEGYSDLEINKTILQQWEGQSRKQYKVDYTYKKTTTIKEYKNDEVISTVGPKEEVLNGNSFDFWADTDEIPLDQFQDFKKIVENIGKEVVTESTPVTTTTSKYRKKDIKEVTYTDAAGTKVDWSNKSKAEGLFKSTEDNAKFWGWADHKTDFDVYPVEYLKSNIETNYIQKPSRAQYNYPTTKSEAIYEVFGTTTKDLPTWTSLGKPTTINQSCILDASFTEDMVIDSTANAVLLVVQGNVGVGQNGKDILIKDKNGVYFFIDDKSTFNLNKTKMWTEDYKTQIATGKVEVNTNQPNVASKYYPHVYIWGGAESKFSGGSEPALVTAHIRAPMTDVVLNNGMLGDLCSTIIYNGETISSNSEWKNIGVIGQLIAGGISVGNQWGMMYVTLGDSSQHCDCCDACTQAPNCPCGCASCIYKKVDGGKTYDKYSVLSYNIY